MSDQKPSIDFSKYTLKELYEARSTVDSEKYPVNAREIERLIDQREKEIADNTTSGGGAERTETEKAVDNGFFRRIISGDISLAKMFWLYWFVIAVLVLPILTNLIIFAALFIHPGLTLPLAALAIASGLAYNVICLIGVWNSAQKYEGTALWKHAARAVVVFQIAATVVFSALQLFQSDPAIEDVKIEGTLKN